MTLAAAAILSLRGIPSRRSFPTLRKKGSEGIVKKLKRLMEKDLKEKEPVRWLQKKTDRSVIIRATVYLAA